MENKLIMKNEKSEEHYRFYALAFCIILASLLFYALLATKPTKPMQKIRNQTLENIFSFDEKKCFQTCSIEIVESIPENLTFNGFIPRSTYESWLDLINDAQNTILIAAYKSSLRGKHVFGNFNQKYSAEGEAIYESIQSAGIDKKILIKMVENGPSKDKGDNEDGKSLENKGAIQRRSLNLRNIVGSGTMHSKFIVVDNKDFYLGSANFDWRSLNQKMELGIYAKNCDCLAQDLTNIFNTYWHGAKAETIERYNEIQRHQPEALFNMQKPLLINYAGEKAEIYLASSPRMKEVPSRTWDLDAIVHEINRAKKYLYIHVMDYFPMYLYTQNKKFWPVLDNALRSAIMRGVDVKLIVAALHNPEISLRFVKSLEALKGLTENATFEARVFKVPTSTNIQKVMQRERRTHNKFLVTETASIIGTSNWAADYFDGKGTGVAVVIQQKIKDKNSFIKKMTEIFIRDWDSSYTHPLDEYLQNCVDQRTADYCESLKDESLFATVQSS
uniref:PLD phosphodiesterase domain-containing protein n=1 Tax=Panagrolaimus sp. JU765 TaxID=591449 RepID=A0AC34R6X9_9BILA